MSKLLFKYTGLIVYWQSTMSFQAYTLAQDCSFDGLDDRECRLHEVITMQTSGATESLKETLRPCVSLCYTERYKRGFEAWFAVKKHSALGLDTGQKQQKPSKSSTI